MCPSTPFDAERSSLNLLCIFILHHIKKGIKSNATRVKGLIGQCIGLCLSAVHPLNTGHVCVDATVCVSVLPKTGKLTPAQCASLESLPALFVELHLPQCRIANGYGTVTDMRM